MLKNYFTLAIKVLGRRKFFTFISLFGISFTLMILMLVAAFWETEFGTNPPLSNKDKIVYGMRSEMWKEHFDTITKIDTQMIDGLMAFDTTITTEVKGKAMNSSSPSLHLLRDKVGDVPFSVNRTIYSSGHTYDIFNKGKKLTLTTVYSDSHFWEVYDFDFLAGKPFYKTQFDNQEQVAVISQKTCAEYFGISNDYESAIGKTLPMDGKSWTIIGVLAEVNVSAGSVNSDVFVPYTNMPSLELESKDYMGDFMAIYLADKPSDREKIKSEIIAKSKLIPLPDPEMFENLDLKPMTYQEQYARHLIYDDAPERSLKLALGSFLMVMLLFFLLPTLNLINLNVSRIMERSSEIGVRKAFGAHSSNILFQFVFENIILTLIGGAIGLVMAYWLIDIINTTQFLDNTKLSFSLPVFVSSFFIILFFGILSGIIPAWRMSKLQIAKALKVNQL